MKERLLVPVGLAMVVAFFAPWIDLYGMVSASGWDLATQDHGNWKRHLLWLYPAGGAALAAVAAGGASRARDARALGVLVGAAVIGLALYDTLSGLRYGALITVAGAVGAVASVASKDRGWAVGAGVLVLIGFFLPWVGERGAMSGLDLARIDTLPDAFGLPSPKWLYAVPVLGAAAAAGGAIATNRAVPALAGLGILLVLGYVYLRTVNVFIGWGAWMTLGGGLAALLIGGLSGPGLLRPRHEAARSGRGPRQG
jgi:hypothetical protein